jgi:hypothetical protein
MNTIWKFPFNIGDQWIEMSHGSRPLTVQMQGPQPTLWALVDPDQPPCGHRIQIYGTGQDIDLTDECSHYVGTFQMRGGSLVFHLFMENQP